jgi:integrase
VVQHKPYRIYRRKTKAHHAGRPVYKYYYALWDAEAHRYGPANSTGCTNRIDAEQWLAKHLQERPYSGLTMGEFATGMYDEDSAYLTYRRQRGRDLSWAHRKHSQTYLEHYILPYFGKTRLESLGILEIEQFQSWLLEQPSRTGTLTPATANHVVQALRSVTRWAIHQRVLHHDPFVGVEPLASSPKRRGIFTIEEVRRIFAVEWPDPRARIMNALACVCGLRKGEVQGLRKSSLQPLPLPDGHTAGVLIIDQSWERSGRLKSPKSGKTRLVSVPPRLTWELDAVILSSPWEYDCLIFAGSDPWVPISHHKIDDDFQRALRAAGISDQERRDRALSFHSWRHFANSWMVNQGLPLLKVQQLVGHTSLKMTQKYLHQQTFHDVLDVQGRILPTT